MNGSTATSENLGKLLLRLAVGPLLLFHGISKLIHGVAWMAGPLAAHHLPAFISYGVYVGEIAAPVLIIAGVYTRLAALTVSFDLLMAFVLVSHSRLMTISPGGGWGVELDAFYFLGGLAIFFLGAGKFSLAGKGGKWN
jgi:putative oxidoreductase